MASEGENSNFRSKSFDPSKALSSSDIRVPVEDAEEYEDLHALRRAVHGQSLLNTEREIPGVLGPGGLPVQRIASVPAERNFDPDQGPIRGRGPKRLRNVLNRMEEMCGPLAILRQCQQENTKVKVYTRNQSEIRGILTGYIVAFDKHWNMALRDVDEIFQKKLRCKTPALGDVSKYVSIGDLTIRERGNYSESESDDEESEMRKMQEVDPTREQGSQRSHFKRYQRDEVETASVAGPATTSLSSSSSSSRGLNYGRGEGQYREQKKMEFIGSYTVESLDQRARSSVPISKEHPLTSEAQDALRLSLSRRKQGPEKEADHVEVEEEEEKGEIEKKKRIRKRKKREIRKRHVNQLFIRGENVVLINVLNE